MIVTLAEGLGAWEATTLAFHERKKPEWADVWTEWNGAAWNVKARTSST